MSNNKIKDGNTEFRVIDKRLFSILDLLYPVGRIIISNDSTAPYSDIGFGTWQEVAKGAFIEGADGNHKAGDNIDAGLPNITGERLSSYGGCDDSRKSSATGCFKQAPDKKFPATTNADAWVGDGNGFKFDASLSNPIYGKSNTVQPKAYVSHYWLRVK